MNAQERDHNVWQNTYGAVSIPKVNTFNLSGEVLCPNCGHKFDEHSVDLGCHVGWTAHMNEESDQPGCDCPLTLALEHGPKSEKDVP